MNLSSVILASMERAPWGWVLTGAVILAIIKGWPAISDAAVRARSAMSADRKSKYDRLDERIATLEAKLERTANALHDTEMKLVSALAAYRLVIGELQKIDPQSAVLKQAQALLNVSYPAPPHADDPPREMIRETHAANGGQR